MSSPAFAVVIPGRPLVTEFEATSESNMVTTLADPYTIRELTVSLLAPDAVPDGHGVGVYSEIPGLDQEFVYLGCLTLDNPTVKFLAPWHREMDAQTAPSSVVLGMSLEPLSELAHKISNDSKQNDLAFDSAAGIARDLHSFMASFARATGEFKEYGDVMILPVDCVDKWYKKFTAKHARQPYFWLKTQPDQVNPI
jgi:hypothetical protein